jgi:hypothetical protein
MAMRDERASQTQLRQTPAWDDEQAHPPMLAALSHCARRGVIPSNCVSSPAGAVPAGHGPTGFVRSPLDDTPPAGFDGGQTGVIG